MNTPIHPLSAEAILQIIHLHVHSEYSLLDGLSRIKELVKKAKSIGSSALGLTDHGVCGGIPDFITTCLNEGIKPIPGCEMYHSKDRLVKGDELKARRKEICLKYNIKEKPFNQFLKDLKWNKGSFEDLATDLIKSYLMNDSADLFSMMDTSSAKEKLAVFENEVYDYMQYQNYHMVLLAIDNQGLEDLYEIVSDAHLHGFYSNPRTDLSFIRERNLGKHIIATSACLGSWLAKLVLGGRMEEAKKFIQECKDTFHSFYLEKQATRTPSQLRLNALLDQLAEETNTPKIVTTDVHYANKEDHQIHDVLVSASIKKCVHDEDRLKYEHEYWMKSTDEILKVFDDVEAIRNTQRIAEMVNVSLPSKHLLPKFMVNEGDTPEELIRKMAWDGLFQYFLKHSVDMDEYSRRLEYELSVITEQGFSDYFLIVSDYLTYAKNRGFIVGPGRGSAAGSLVAMCLRITSIDPIKYNLMFERFLSPDRISYPDIDSDMPWDACREVFHYLCHKYGHDRVSQIGTYGTLAARAVCRLVGKTLGYSLQEQDAFAKAIPKTAEHLCRETDPKEKGRDGAYELEPQVQMYAQRYPDWWEAMKKLEGHIRQEGSHAGGVVLSPEKLTRVTPLRLDSDKLTTTQFDMEWIEKFLVKFDILKLNTLALIKKTMEFAGIWGKVDLDMIDLNDPLIYERVYNSLNLCGIFQVDGDGMRDVIKEMKPNCFEDVVAILALYRPGPLEFIPSYIRRKHGLEKVTYDFPECEDILKDTYGILVYQEQCMKMSIALGGLTQGQSDWIRTAVAKKKMDLINEWVGYMIYGSAEKDKELIAQGKKPLNIPGALSKGHDEKKLLRLKEEWIKFGDYALI